MRVVCCGYTTLTTASHLVFRPVTPQRLRRITQCPGLIIQHPEVIKKCLETVKMRPEITPLRSLVMCACAPLLKIYLVRYGITQPYHLALVTVPQCPGITRQTDKQTPRKQCLPLLRKRGIASIEERGEQESVLKKKRHLIMMRSGPLRAQELLPVPLFQTD